MKRVVVLPFVIVATLAACSERPPTAPDARDGGSPALQLLASDAVQVSAGPYHVCTLASDGTITCTGQNHSGQATALAGKFTQVSAGDSHTCALRNGGTVVCWGSNFAGEAAAPNGSFTQVSTGANLTCGLQRNGTIDCWGYSDLGDQTTPPDGRFTQITVAAGYGCALREDGTAECWGWFPGTGTGPEGTQPAGEFIQLDGGTAHVCGVRPTGTVACWGSDADGQSTPPAGRFTQVSAGWSHTCAVTREGSIACWGDDAAGATDAPAGQFTQVSAGRGYTCAVRVDGAVVCWGAVPAAEAPPALDAISASGSGSILDHAGRKLHFTFGIKLRPEEGSAPTGNVRFRLAEAGITLESTVLYTVDVVGDMVIVRGIGMADLGSHEREVDFVLMATDGQFAGTAAAPDAFRIQLWTDEFNALEYDSAGDAPGTTASPLLHGNVRVAIE